jgi:hypothetical protein
MTTGLQRSANRTTDVHRGADVHVAWYCDFVLASRNCALDHDTAICFRGILVLPARQAVDTVPARQHDIDVGNDRTALFVALAAALVLTVVIATFLHPIAGLGAIDGLVETVRMTLIHTGVAAWKTFSTQKVAPSFWRNDGEVIWRGDLKRRFRVARAAEVQVGAHIAVFPKDVQNLAPHWDMRGRFRVSDDIHAVLSA